jgi:hypothetical protein
MKKLVQLGLFLLFFTTIHFGWSQTYTFTTGGATANIGPTQLQLNAAYASTNLAGNVTSVGGIQYWVVPATANYEIEAFGGQGYGPFGGRGAHISGEFALNAGDTLKILVGQLGGHYLNYPATTYNHQFGGGGGSFVTRTNNTPLVVAGGGGGNHSTAYIVACDGQITTNGSGGAMGATLAVGGTNGNGGAAAASADGGGGLLSNGLGIAGGKSFLLGGQGGIDEGTGGFGGGGGTSSWNNYRGGGGGGYSGGGGGNNGSTCCAAGGGGGSFNGGLNPVNLAGVQIGNGSVIIRQLSLPPNDGGAYAILGFVPPVCAGTYPVEVTIKNFGSNQINPITVKWTVNGIPQPDSIVTTVIDTVGGSLPDSLNVVLGNIAITAATNIKIWTTLPNNLSDPTSANDTIEVNIAAPAIVSAVVSNNIVCFGASTGNATASGTGGLPSYSYLWSNGAPTAALTGVPAGTYSVVLTDGNGCTDSTSVVITEPTQMVISDSTSDITCNGDNDGQSQIAVSGGSPGYSILWSTGDSSWAISGLAAGDYSYIVTDSAGCTMADTVTITEPAAIALSSVVTDEITSSPGNGAVDLTVAGGTAGYTFLWSNGATTEDLTGLTAGTYLVTVTDANGCTDTLTAVVGLIVGTQMPINGFDFSLSPNPSNGTCKIVVTGQFDNISIVVTDLLGKQLVSIPNADATTRLDLNIDSGIYLVKLTSGNEVLTKRLVVTR